jgi:predicted acylesterase/phospholipase RssA
MPNIDSSPLKLEGKRVVLFLQGGGALGSYQVGAYKVLEAACQQANNKVDWVGGISIGAINAALIAAPMSGDAAAELKQLWDEILSPSFPPFDYNSLWRSVPPFLRPGWLESLIPKYADWTWMAFNPFGQQNFFGSRVLNPLQNPWFLQWARPLEASELAFYDTELLRRTLDKHVKWESINQDGATWLSLGAVRVRDGELVFFNCFASDYHPDWGPKAIRADHVLASGALPPGFPGISIDGELYWDGGLCSNTPIEELADELEADVTRDTIVFLIDLWDPKGPIPRSLDEVLWRQKCIQYGSRRRAAVRIVETHELEAKLQVEEHKVSPGKLEVCQVMFERSRDDWTPQFSFADADFSRTTYEQMAKLGCEEAPVSRARGRAETTLSFIGTVLMASTMKTTGSTPQ